MRRTIFSIALGLSIMTSVTTANAQAFLDTFDSIDPAWVTDRYAPSGFNSVFFDGDNRLEITISDADKASNRPPAFSSAFYDTQGKRRQALIGADWIVSGDLYVSDDMVSGNNLRRTDLWARTGNVGNETGVTYAIFGIRRFDPASAYNPLAPSISSTWRVWDTPNGGWQNLSAPIQTGWNNLAIVGTASGIDYYLNGNWVYTGSYNSGLKGLTDVFVQAFNFGAGDYNVYWDNVSADVIPEPAFFQMGALAAMSGLGLLRLRRKS